MQERVYRTPILDVADMNRRLIAAWSGLQHHVIDEATDQWRGQQGLIFHAYRHGRTW